eukprot:2635176-Amphidinium_carterae.1
MTQEMKSIGDRGREAADILVKAFQKRSALRSATQKSAEAMEIDRLRHERELLMGEREAAQQQTTTSRPVLSAGASSSNGASE